MPKKKTPRNAFYFFMRDFKEEQEQMGHTFRGGMKEVAIAAGPAWTEISPEQRLYYENLAAQEKMKEKGNLENKFTTTGISYAQLQREEDERRSTEMQMLMEIEGTVQGLSRSTTLKTHVFYFIHFNYYCRTEGGIYLVCEVAVAQFNLKEGVKDVYHTLILHDKIPTGYSFEAKQTSEETHQIPMPHDLSEGEGEPYNGNLFAYIKSFLEQNKLSNGKLPPLYTIDNHVDIAQCALTSLAENHYPQNTEIFRVYPLSKLFYRLRNAAAPTGYDGFPAETLAERELDKDQYNFAPGIACPLHEKNDTCVYCSKSIVQRWAYLICDHCCKDLGITMLRGKHVPLNAALHVERLSSLASEDDDFLPVARRHPRAAGSTRGGSGGGTGGGHSGGQRWVSPPRAPEKVPILTPIHLVDHSKIGPPEEFAHHFNLNAAAVGVAPPSATPSTGSSVGGGSTGAKGAWASGGKGLSWDKAPATVGVGAGRGVLTPSPSANVPVGRVALINGGSGAIPKVKAGGRAWNNGGGHAEETSPPSTLRRPTNLPPSITNVINFTEEDFPDLGGSNHTRTPAAVAGRGRGNARLLMDGTGGAVPGGLNEDQSEKSFGQVAAGRGFLGRPGSRIAANFQGLSLN